ncbi:MAG: hypothetical protein CML07_01230 [Psychrobacter sp.]|nr:hypothetical protein [Psychrobacter sp.]
MDAKETVEKWREKKSKEGGRSMSVWLEPEAVQALDEIKAALELTNAKIINKSLLVFSRVLKDSTQLHVITKLLDGQISLFPGTEPIKQKVKPATKEIQAEMPPALADIKNRCDQGTPMKEMKSEIVDVIKTMLEQNLSRTKIADRFNAWGLLTMSGDGKWGHSQIGRMLKNKPMVQEVAGDQEKNH